MADLLDAQGVADKLGISVDQVKRRTKAEGWPCVRFSAKSIRYRQEHIEQIIAMYEATAKQAAPSSGLTTRSRRRAS